MTAEIAVLNKTAVALATDSAVTISYGNSHEKVFDSADKLFELCTSVPIGIMIYNGMQFSGIPLPDLIKEFRANCVSYQSVEQAADAFLSFLAEAGKNAPDSAKLAVVSQVILPLFEAIDDALNKKIRSELTKHRDDGADLEDFFSKTMERIVAVAQRTINKAGPGTFYGGVKPPRLLKLELDFVKNMVSERFAFHTEKNREALVHLAKAALLSNRMSNARTGIVISGFGLKERFPTLISYEVEGVICKRLKLKKTAKCDIDRDGEQAFIQPFAQKEMVERFLYGLDKDIQNKINQYVSETVTTITDSVFSRLSSLDEETLKELKDQTTAAESVFLANLKNKAFQSIENQSRKEIEDMIQFMPKPELAKMAEALVDLTSIKRKVSVGVETVGGPVDVAVISKSEGFVWVKRKHYFPPNLNGRYFNRLLENTKRGTKDDQT
jgi:hypothetical protein